MSHPIISNLGVHGYTLISSSHQHCISISNTIDRQEKLKIVYTEKQALKCLENYFIDSIRSQEGDENDVGSNSSNEQILS